MAWIKSYQELERHPKIIRLMDDMGWDLDTAIGKLHRFWWWCLDYAQDGRLDGFSKNQIAASCGAVDGEKFICALQSSGFVDTAPYARLHDWWEHAGEYLKGRLSSKPEQLRAIKDSYSGATPELLRSYSGVTPKNFGKTSPQIRVDKIRVDNTDMSDKSDGFESFWKVYPRKTGKGAAYKAWKKANPPIDKCLSTLGWQVKSEQWIKDNGQYIPLPATWLNQGRWEDVSPDHKVVNCSKCGAEGILPKGAQGQPLCRKCKGEAIASQKQGVK